MAKYVSCVCCNNLNTEGLDNVELFCGLCAVSMLFSKLDRFSFNWCTKSFHTIYPVKVVSAKRLMEIQCCAGLASPFIKIREKILSDSEVGKCL